MHCAAVLYIAFPGFFLKELTKCEVVITPVLLFVAIIEKKQILKGSLFRKIRFIMIRDEFRTPSKRNDDAKSRYVF